MPVIQAAWQALQPVLKGAKPTFVLVQSSANHQTASAATRLVHAQLKVTPDSRMPAIAHKYCINSDSMTMKTTVCLSMFAQSAGPVRQQQSYPLSCGLHHKTLDPCSKYI